MKNADIFDIKVNDKIKFIAEACYVKDEENVEFDYRYKVKYKLFKDKVAGDSFKIHSFDLKLTQKGRLSNDKLGKLIASHVLMCLLAGCVGLDEEDKENYDSLIKGENICLSSCLQIKGKE